MNEQAGEIMHWILPLIGGLGIGSMVTRFIEHYLKRKSFKADKFYQEKREANFGLLDALLKASISPGHEASAIYSLWQAKIEIFGPKGASDAAKAMVTTPSLDQQARIKFLKSYWKK